MLDFDDLLLYWDGMMAVPELAEEVGRLFDFVFVDEYQDTNRLQASILQRLKPQGQGVTVVGDDAQAIYGFRAATVRNILDFPDQYTPRADVVALDRNYRSTGAILQASNAVMALATEGYTKCLVTDRAAGSPPCLTTVADEHAQAQCVADRIVQHLEEGIALRSQAVLFRSSHHSAQVELELTRRKIPFVKFGGLRFLDAAHVRDVLGILRWVENPRGRMAGFRTLRLLPGVGPVTATRLLDIVEAQADPMSTLGTLAVPPPAREAWTALADVLRRIHARELRWPAELESVLAWYRPELQRLHEDAPDRGADLGQLLQIAGAYRFARAVPHGPDARPAFGHQRASREPVARGRLPDAIHDPLGERAGVEVGPGLELCRRLHSVRPRHRQHRRDRGGAAPAVRGDDAGQGSPRAAAAAAVLRHATGTVRRSACLRESQPLHSTGARWPLRPSHRRVLRGDVGPADGNGAACEGGGPARCAAGALVGRQTTAAAPAGDRA